MAIMELHQSNQSTCEMPAKLAKFMQHLQMRAEPKKERQSFIYIKQGGRQRGGQGGLAPHHFFGFKSSNNDVIMTSSLNTAPPTLEILSTPLT